MPTRVALPTLGEQAGRLIHLGVHDAAGINAADLLSGVARAHSSSGTGALLVIHPDLVPPSALAGLLQHGGRHGFVVPDMTDVDQFAPIDGVAPPTEPFYLLHDLDRGDAMANWTPDEALPAITQSGRTPLTLVEGLHWLIQRPDVLERNHCFMTIGSRLRKPTGELDARTPGIWLSNGTGRDGTEHRNAPKVGWCWAGNRHTWLGFASAAERTPVPRG